MTRAGFPHSDTPGSQLGCQLPRAYRRLQRPSSALDAKASTMCPSQLAATNTTPHPTQQTTRSTDHTINRPHDQQTTRSTQGTTRHRPRRHATKETHTTTTTRTNRRTNRNQPANQQRARDRAVMHRSTQIYIHTFHRTNPTHPATARQADSIRWRCSRPLFTSQTTTPHHPPTGQAHAQQPDGRYGRDPQDHRPATTTRATPLNDQREGADLGGGARAVRSQNPNSVPPPEPRPERGVDRTSTSEHPNECPPVPTDERRPRPVGVGVLLRKEVIQPHLPVRLPCYDFVPIASPTFDHSLPQAGWAMGFGCCRLS